MPSPAVIRTVCLQTFFIADDIPCSQRFFLIFHFMRELRASHEVAITSHEVALHSSLAALSSSEKSREIFMFHAAIWSSLHFWGLRYRFSPPLIALVPQDSNVALFCSFTYKSKSVDCVACCIHAIVRLIFMFRSLIGLLNWFIKSAKSGQQAKTIPNVAGGNFTCGIPCGLCPRCNMAAPPPLAH